MILQDGGSAPDLFTGSGDIYKVDYDTLSLLFSTVTKNHSPSFKYHESLSEYIMSPLTSIVNFRHFRSFLAPYSQFPTSYLYFKMFLTGPTDTLNPGRSILK